MKLLVVLEQTSMISIGVVRGAGDFSTTRTQEGLLVFCFARKARPGLRVQSMSNEEDESNAFLGGFFALSLVPSPSS